METGGWALGRSQVRSEGCARLLPSSPCHGVLVSHGHMGTHACRSLSHTQVAVWPCGLLALVGRDGAARGCTVCSVSSSYPPWGPLQGRGWAEWVHGSVPGHTTVPLGPRARLESQV